MEPSKCGLGFDCREKLFRHLNELGVPFRELDHCPEGRTIEASAIRGHSLSEAAKSIVIEVRISSTRRHYVVAVVPGDRKVDLDAIATLGGGRRAGFASPSLAERLTGCPMGAVVPFAFHDGLELIADPSLLTAEQIVFNAGALDTSLFMNIEDYLLAARPRVAPIALM